MVLAGKNVITKSCRTAPVMKENCCCDRPKKQISGKKILAFSKRQAKNQLFLQELIIKGPVNSGFQGNNT